MPTTTGSGVLPSSMNPASLEMGSDTSNVGLGAIDRSENINLTLAALVAQVLPNGNLAISGHQQVLVNSEMRDLKVEGIVRTEDITADNTVDLSQIAEARVSYGGKGQETDVQQPRYGSQLFDILIFSVTSSGSPSPQSRLAATRRKSTAPAGHQRQSRPQGIAGGGVGVVRQHVQEQVGQLQPRQMLSDAWRENQPLAATPCAWASRHIFAANLG